MEAFRQGMRQPEVDFDSWGNGRLVRPKRLSFRGRPNGLSLCKGRLSG
jgi:hypothetical protein